MKTHMDIKEIRIRAALGTMRLFSRLPLKFHYFFWDGVSWFLRHVACYRREVVLTNIARSFPEKDYAAVRKIEAGFYRHLGEIAAEAIWVSGSDYARIHESHICTMTNLEDLAEAYRNSPSVCVLSSHCGNWELLGGLWTFNYNEAVDYPSDEHCVKVVYKKLRNEVSNEIFKRNRCAAIRDFHGEIESEEILRYAIRNRDKRFIYVFPTDQFPYASAHDVGPFLNQKTKVMLGSAALAHKLGMSVMFMKMSRVERGRYEMTFVPICSNAAEMEPEEIMRKYFDLLEEQIRERPEDWLWSHKRWKL